MKVRKRLPYRAFTQFNDSMRRATIAFYKLFLIDQYAVYKIVSIKPDSWERYKILLKILFVELYFEVGTGKIDLFFHPEKHRDDIKQYKERLKHLSEQIYAEWKQPTKLQVATFMFPGKADRERLLNFAEKHE